MIHARDDYNRIQDPAGKIGSDEPVFLIRAQDKSAPATLRFWAEENHRNGGDAALSELAEEHADAMEAWQRTHFNKPADLTPNFVFWRQFCCVTLAVLHSIAQVGWLKSLWTQAFSWSGGNRWLRNRPQKAAPTPEGHKHTRGSLFIGRPGRQPTAANGLMV